MSNTMRCLSVRQPYAWAICVGIKTIENRVWKTDYRGKIAVHASQSPQYVNELRRSTKSELFGKDDFALGAIIGTVELVDVAPYGPAHESNSHATGPYCLVLKNAKLFKTPIPMKGKLNHLPRTTATCVDSIRAVFGHRSYGSFYGQLNSGLELTLLNRWSSVGSSIVIAEAYFPLSGNVMSDRIMGEQSPRSIFTAATKIENSLERQAYLDEVCQGDPALRDKVQRLLVVQFRQANNRLDRLEDAFGPAQTLDITLANETFKIDVDCHPEIGPYKLLEQIGEGGMGTVFMAVQSQPIQRMVALKIIKPGMDTGQVIARFEAERQALAMMNHPNIAKVLDAGTTDAGLPYFAMELVRGIPITEFCDVHELDLGQRLEMFMTVCQAVQHAHQKGIIHRDLKPSNILVEMQDVTAVPKVIDFGVAKAIHQPLTDRTLHTGFSQMIGTPLYMSPEQTQMSSLDVDTRSDIYSLGVLLYELLTGRTPLASETLERAGFDEMRRIIREDEPQRPSERISTLEVAALSTISEKRKVDPRSLSHRMRGELDWIVLKAMEKDRVRRYDSASAMADDLQRYLADDPVEARPASRAYRLKKFVRKHRSLLAAMVTLLSVMLLGTCVSLWQAQRATVARVKAEKNLSFAMQVVDDMYSDIATKWIDSDSALTDVQATFVRKAIVFYDAVLEHPDEYSASDSQLAQMAFRSGLLFSKLMKYDEALVRFEQGLTIVERSLPAMPSNESLRFQQVELLNAASICNEELANYDIAREHIVQSLEQLAGLVADFPDNPEYHMARSMYAIDLSNLEVACGNALAAEACIRESIRLYGDTSPQDPNQIALHLTLAQSLMAQNRHQEAAALQQKWLTQCRFALLRTGDSAMLRELERLLLDGLFHALLLQEEFEEADKTGTLWIERLVNATATNVDPARHFMESFTAASFEHSTDQMVLFSEWIQATILVAENRARLGRALEAELMLGRAKAVAVILDVMYPLDGNSGAAAQLVPSNQRHRVDLANVYVSLSMVLQDRFPAEARHYAMMAAESWRQGVEAYSRVVEFRSGTRATPENWNLSDFQWFTRQFPELDVRDPAKASLAVEALKQPIPPVPEQRALAALWYEGKQFDSALALCKAVQKQRPDPYAMYLESICLFELNRLDESQAKFAAAEELLSSPEPVLLEIQNRAKELLRE